MPTFVAPDGLQLVFDAFEAPHPSGALLILHGWSDHAGRWAETAEKLKASGYSAYVLDLRGHGRSGGQRGHLSRFSQLLGDLHAFRRVVRVRTGAAQVLMGHSFGGLVVLRYLETQPLEPVAASIVASPFLVLGFAVNPLKLLAGRLLADLAPRVSLPTGLDSEALSRDPAVGPAYRADPLVHNRMTAGAWKEIQWAQGAVASDAHRIEGPIQFLLTGEDRIVDAGRARAFADGLRGEVQVRWYPEIYHEALHDPQRDQVFADVLTFLAGTVRQSRP